MIKNQAKRLLAVLFIMVLSVTLLSVNVSAAEVRKTRNVNFSYYDPTFTSLRYGQITSTYQWTYNNSTKKLVNKKSINHTESTAFFCSFNKVKPIWNWYNTTKKNGDAQGTVKWEFVQGIETAWFTIGAKFGGWSSLVIKANGSSTAYHS